MAGILFCRLNSGGSARGPREKMEKWKKELTKSDRQLAGSDGLGFGAPYRVWTGSDRVETIKDEFSTLKYPIYIVPVPVEALVEQVEQVVAHLA